MNPKHELSTRLALAKLEMEALSKEVHRLPEKAEEGSLEAEECLDFYIRDIDGIIDDTNSLRELITQWNPTPQEIELKQTQLENVKNF